jgi:hypothetical protein
MSYHRSLSMPDPPPASREASAAPTALEFGCHVPLVLLPCEAQAKIVLWFKLERQAGPLTQGTVIRSATLPASSSLQLQPNDARACFVLETDGVSVFRRETAPAEVRYWNNLLYQLGQLGTPSAHAIDLVQVQGEPVNYPFIPTVLRVLVERTEALSRMSETAARTTQSEPSSDGSPLPARLLINPNRSRAMTLFFYQADKYEVVRFGLRRIDRVVVAPAVKIETQVRAEIDRQLEQLGLIDPHGQVTPAALTQFGWQRTFVLPTPHILVKTCLVDKSITESSVFGAIKIDPRHRPGQAA